MKQIITFLLLMTGTIVYSQDCEYRYEYPCIVIRELDTTLKTEDKVRISQNILDYKSCLARIVDKNKRYWLNNSIAIELDILNRPQDSISFYAKRAFDDNPINFCKDYIKVHVYHERGELFPMKPHYIDKAHTSELILIRDYCIENYKDSELKIYTDIDDEKEVVKKTSEFNELYFSELADLAIKDQEERVKGDLNWERQNQLDSLNRIKLDSLYLLHGFPSMSKVAEDGFTSAFMVLHHSTDCEWNEIWFERFLEEGISDRFNDITSFYLYRNFNKENGICNHKTDFFHKLKMRKDLIELLDFDRFKETKK